MKVTINTSFYALALINVMLISGCTSTPIHTYDGPHQARENIAVLSPVGTNGELNLSMTVNAIDDKYVSAYASEYLILPGQHKIKLRVVKDWTGVVYSKYKVATIEITLTAVAGHSYIPNADVMDMKVYGRFDDFGLNYPQKCMPIYRLVINKSTPVKQQDCYANQ
jgi:hypothetical protein